MIASDVLLSPVVVVHIVRKIFHIRGFIPSRDYIAFRGRSVGIYSETIDKKIIFDLHEVEDMWKYVK